MINYKNSDDHNSSLSKTEIKKKVLSIKRNKNNLKDCPRSHAKSIVYVTYKRTEVVEIFDFSLQRTHIQQRLANTICRDRSVFDSAKLKFLTEHNCWKCKFGCHEGVF